MFALQWLLHFDVFSHIPLDSPATYSTLARASRVPESQLKSVARMAMTSSILTEPETGRVAHTSTSAMFLKFPNIRNWATYMFTASIPTAGAVVKATEKWPGSVEKTETAYNIAFNHNLSFFDHLSQSPELTKQFSGYMKSVTDGQAMDLSHLVRGFEWDGLPNGALVVDVSKRAKRWLFTPRTDMHRLEARPGMPVWPLRPASLICSSRCRTLRP